MTHPSASARKSALELAIEARGEVVYTFPVSGFFGLGAKPVLHIGFRMQGSIDDDTAVVAAHEYVEQLTRVSGDAGPAARADGDLLDNAKTIEALWRCTREVEEKPSGSGDWKPTGFPAFAGGPTWMRKHLSKREIAILFDLLAEAKRLDGRKRGIVEDIDDAAVEALAKTCDEHAATDIPEALLAGVARPVLTHLVVLLAGKLGAARLSVETLLVEREAMGVESDPAVPQAT
jgi:hypothetical protein